MTETPQGRNRRVNRSRPEDIAPQSRTRTPQARAPIGRSQELLERQGSPSASCPPTAILTRRISPPALPNLYERKSAVISTPCCGCWSP